MTERRFVLHPGYVEAHFVSARRLAALYNVSMADCMISDEDGQVRGMNTQHMQHLYPLRRGDYPYGLKLSYDEWLSLPEQERIIAGDPRAYRLEANDD
jgi:hypothetical protein